MKDEGLFFLRYRVFNALFQVAGPTPIPILAECIGGPFRVYSTKNFPGLRASTDLTKVCLFYALLPFLGFGALGSESASH